MDVELSVSFNREISSDIQDFAKAVGLTEYDVVLTAFTTYRELVLAQTSGAEIQIVWPPKPETRQPFQLEYPNKET